MADFEMLINDILAVVLCLCLTGLIIIGKFTLTHCDTKKIIPFISLLAAIFLTVLGYLMEITAGTADGGFTAIKLSYAGMMFLSVTYLIFVFSFCKVDFSKAAVWLLVALATAISILIWTTDKHKLIYVSVGYVNDAPIHHIQTVKGKIYYVMHIFPILCGVTSIIVLLNRFVKWDKKYRVNIILLMLGLIIPLSVDFLFLFMASLFRINLTPALMTVVSLLFYVNIVRNHLFDILPRAHEIALQSIKEAFILIDRDKSFLHANEAAVELLPMLKTLKKETRLNHVQNWPFELQTDEVDDVSHVKFSMNEDNHYNAEISPLIDNKQKLLGYIIIIQDITESVIMTRRLEELAFTDGLTGIATRQHFMNLASVQFERTKRINGNSFIIMFDLDHFKEVNDTYGHLVGDKVLKCVADRVKDIIRPYDLFGRYGGEEFIMFISDIGEDDIKVQVERIREAICSTPMTFEETALTVSASFGAASVLSSDDFSDVVKLSDDVLYKAKNGGRNKVVFF